jgi:outer membrane receptor protein involved in Fe transport
MKMGALAKLSFASAAREKRVRTELFGATPCFRFILGGSYRDVKDARAGRGIGLQVPTSGEELNWDLNVQFRPKPIHTFEFSVQDVSRDKVHRFYRPTQTNFNDRTGASLKYKGSKIFTSTDKLNFTLYYQHKKDTRKWFETSKKIKEEKTGWAITKTYSSDLQWSNLFRGKHLLTSGVYFELDDAEDPDDEQFTIRTETDVKKDAPDSYWMNYAFYLQDEWNLTPLLKITLGARWDRFNFKSKLDPLYQPLSGNPSVDEIEESEDAFTGGVGILYGVTENVNLFGNFSRGFRQYAPVFGIKEHAYGIQVPSGLLDPAVSLNYELGVKFRNDRLRGSSTLYYTDLRDLPVVLPGTFQGKDWYDWNSNNTRDPGEDVYVIHSAAKAYVYGMEVEGQYRVGSGFSFHAGFNWNYGKDITNDEPLRHTIPAWGLVKLVWEEPKEHKIWLEFTAEMASSFDRIPSDRIEKDPGYRLDPQDMSSPLLRPNGEVPGWTVYHLRGEYLLNKNVRLNLAVENLTDRAYRRVHSRWDELGINFVLGLTFTI